jgi:hypothetical protein
MSKSPFEKATVYHSAIVKETQDNGPLEISLLCDEPEESKFKGRPKQIAFKCYGETHYYPIENDRCGDALSGYKGKTIKIVASGREKEAAIEVDGDGHRHHREERRESRDDRSDRGEERGGRDNRREASISHRKSAEEREEEQREAFTKAKHFAAKCGVLMDVCLHVAEGLVTKHIPEGNPEDVRALATTIFIETKSSTDIHKLPVKWIDTKQRQQQQPPAREERAPEPPPREERPPERAHPAIDDSDAESDIPF